MLKTAAAALAVPSIARGAAGNVLKFVPYTDLAVLDPIVTGNYAVRNHALMIYDTLYGMDTQLTPQPQMLDGHTVDNDGKTWNLTLREGLRFHDNTPVLARDTVASIRRWGLRDLYGGMLMEATDELSAPDDRTIRFRLKAPFPLLPNALGKYVGNVMVVMPERLAATDPAKPVPELIGSGPYLYVTAERLQGARNVYQRFAGYAPRPGPAQSRTAGAKIAHFERIEWLTIPDAATAAAALQKGEVDWWEDVSADYLPELRRLKSLRTGIIDKSGYYGYVRLNHLNPPFNNPATRRAALAAISQTDMLDAIVGTDPTLSRAGVGFFAPDSPMASNAGMEALQDPPDLARAAQLLKQSGYAGEKTVIEVVGPIAGLKAIGEVANAAWKSIGFNVELRALEIAAALPHLASQAPVEQGGWSAASEAFSSVAGADPVLFAQMRAVGRGGTFGWPDIPKLVELRDAYIASDDLAARQAICRQIQLVCYDQVPIIPIGIYYKSTAYSNSLTGMLDGFPLFTNIRRG